MKSKLTSLVLASSLILGLTGCKDQKKDPDKYDLKESYRLGNMCPDLNCKNHDISKDLSLEEGYLNPSKIVFQIRDQNQNGREELVMQYEGKRYLMKVDSQSGNAVLIPYTKKNEILEELK